MHTMNPHAPFDEIAALLDSSTEAAFRPDKQEFQSIVQEITMLVELVQWWQACEIKNR